MSVATLPATNPDQPARGRHDVTGRHYGARIDHDGAREALLARIRDFTDLLGGLHQGLGLAARKAGKVVDIVPEMAILNAITNLATAAGAIEHGKVFELADEDEPQVPDADLVDVDQGMVAIKLTALRKTRQTEYEAGRLFEASRCNNHPAA